MNLQLYTIKATIQAVSWKQARSWALKPWLPFVITAYTIPDAPGNNHAPDLQYDVENFIYSPENDSYTCPQGHELTTNGSWYEKKGLRFKQYKTKACSQCPVKALCTTSQERGRMIQRSEYAAYIEQNKINITCKQHLYKNRKAIVEHPFGTIKRQWGFDYVLTKKGMERAGADVGLMFTAYNLRRLINIIGMKSFKEYLKKVLFAVFSSYLPIWRQVKKMLRLAFKNRVIFRDRKTSSSILIFQFKSLRNH